MKEFLKSLVWVDYFYMVFTDPGKLAAALMRESKSLPLGFVVPACVSIMEILALSLLGSQTPFFYTKITYGWILFFILLVFQNILIGSLIDTAGQVMGYQGNIKNVINIMNYALFPRVLLLPAILIFSVFNFAPVFFYVLFSMALFAWSAAIVIQGISEMHSATLNRAAAVFFIPFALVGGVAFFAMVLTVISIFGYFNA
ncbi:MAG TPA: YIP1 family protein [Spirochaetota bacterium]|nr:YIP1 family protein [Spirochaetota bacterium]